MIEEISLGMRIWSNFVIKVICIYIADIFCSPLSPLWDYTHIFLDTQIHCRVNFSWIGQALVHRPSTQKQHTPPWFQGGGHSWHALDPTIPPLLPIPVSSADITSWSHSPFCWVLMWPQNFSTCIPIGTLTHSPLTWGWAKSCRSGGFWPVLMIFLCIPSFYS